jgi:hypothetical protein
LRTIFPTITAEVEVQPVKAQPAFATDARQALPYARRRHAETTLRLLGRT